MPVEPLPAAVPPGLRALLPDPRRLVSGFAAGRLLAAAVNVLVVPIETHLVDQQAFAVAAALQAEVLLANAMLSWWVQQAATRFLAEGAAAAYEATLARIVSVSLVCAGLQTLVLLLWVYLAERHAAGTALACAAYGASVAWFEFMSVRSVAGLDQGRFLRMTLTRAVSLLAAVLALAPPLGAVGIILAATASNLCGVLAGWRRLPVPGGAATEVSLRQMLRYGLPLMVVHLCGVVLGYLDRAIGFHLLPAADAGAYAAIYDPVWSAVVVPLQAVAMTVAPRVYRSGDGERVGRLVGQGLGLMLACGLPLVLAVLLLGPTLARHIYPAYVAERALPIIGPVAAAAVLACMKGLALDTVLQWRLLSSTQAALAAAAAVLKVGLLILLVPRLGLLGLAVSTFAAYACLVAGTAVVAARTLALPAARRQILPVTGLALGLLTATLLLRLAG